MNLNKENKQTMKSTLLSRGEKIHVMHLRRFEKDVRRHFVGEVKGYEQGVARASGYVFVIDDLSQHLFVKRPDRRTKFVPIGSGDVIVNIIPETVDLEQVAYELKDRSLVVTDGSAWSMEVKEFGWG
jgi:hypothetical protein